MNDDGARKGNLHFPMLKGGITRKYTWTPSGGHPCVSSKMHASQFGLIHVFTTAVSLTFHYITNPNNAPMMREITKITIHLVKSSLILTKKCVTFNDSRVILGFSHLSKNLDWNLVSASWRGGVNTCHTLSVEALSIWFHPNLICNKNGTYLPMFEKNVWVLRKFFGPLENVVTFAWISIFP